MPGPDLRRGDVVCDPDGNPLVVWSADVRAGVVHCFPVWEEGDDLPPRDARQLPATLDWSDGRQAHVRIITDMRRHPRIADVELQGRVSDVVVSDLERDHARQVLMTMAPDCEARKAA